MEDVMLVKTILNKKFLSFKRITSRGFTLIELLVVIAILGLLAAALIATIDPFEQLKKTQDASLKDTAVEVVDANVRYYSTHNALPWNPAPGGACNSSTNPNGLQLSSAAMTACIQLLVNDGELKQGFFNFT